ncbi:MAG: NADH-quinone oxidoreductase subunit L [Chloroflexi bacterium]|nr:NADH-quinone oxidoreductase subunit L [Chloroflexota bacterium]
MNLALDHAWLIAALPAAASLLIQLMPSRAERWAGPLAVGAGALAALLALLAALAVAGGATAAGSLRWAPAADGVIALGYRIDGLAAALIAMVAPVSAVIQLFAIGYMAHDPRQARFFGFTTLFSAAMLTAVIADNLLLLFIAWEVMGLCSYLLIGFWYERDGAAMRPAPREAAIKAFLITRVGDVLFLLGIALLWHETGSLHFGTAPGQLFAPEALAHLAATPALPGIPAASLAALLLFAGTVGKSAQFPLHVWLPDAMAGPTPVSALIHAATMVAAGVFLVARTYPIFAASSILPWVAAIGALTAVGAALVALVQTDLKRVLAYSTISQLGFMVAALGIGAWGAAIFHLITHACFKALLFLGAGAIIHAMEQAVGHDGPTQDIRAMGGLRRHMPLTFVTYLLGAAALAGLPPLAGFWSKDEIVAHALTHGAWGVAAALLAASLLTAAYLTRQVWLVFFGSFRGGATVPHDATGAMRLPLVLLAAAAVLVGGINLPWQHGLSDLIGAEVGAFHPGIAALATLVALAGGGLGWALRGIATDADLAQPNARGALALLAQGYRLDMLYRRSFGAAIDVAMNLRRWVDRAIIGRLIALVGTTAGLVGRITASIDDIVLQGGADLAGRGVDELGGEVRRSATGRIQDALALVVGGVVLFAVAAVTLLRP